MTDTLRSTLDWFKEAVPTPTDRNVAVQLGCHLEEVEEMLREIAFTDMDAVLDLQSAREFLLNLATYLKSSVGTVEVRNRKKLLDAICDQIVTGTGVAHMLQMDILEAMREVNNSNYSKFVDGKAVFDENGKIKKGAGYFRPNLEPFI